MKALILSLMIGALGFLAGYSVGQRPSPSPVLGLDPAKQRPPLAFIVPAVSQNNKKEAAGDSNLVLNRLQVLAWISANHAGSLFLPPVQFGKITPEFLKAYELSEADGFALQQAVDSATQQLSDAAISNASVSKVGEGVSITVPQLPEIGSKIYDRLHSVFAQVMGSARYEFFRSISQDSLDGAYDFAGFGVNKIEYTVSKPELKGSLLVFPVEVTMTPPNGQKSKSISSLDWKTLAQRFPIVGKLYPK